MPFQKGNPGRPKGAKNKHSFNAEELAQKLDCNPLEILLRFAAGDWEGLGYDSSIIVSEKEDGNGKGTFIKYTITPEVRVKASEQACKYLYSAKHAVDVAGEVGIKLIIEDYTKKK